MNSNQSSDPSPDPLLIVALLLVAVDIREARTLISCERGQGKCFAYSRCDVGSPVFSYVRFIRQTRMFMLTYCTVRCKKYVVFHQSKGVGIVHHDHVFFHAGFPACTFLLVSHTQYGGKREVEMHRRPYYYLAKE